MINSLLARASSQRQLRSVVSFSWMFHALGLIASLFGTCCWLYIMFKMMDKALWKGLLCLVFPPITLYFGIVEFEDEHKWQIVLFMIFAGSLAAFFFRL